MLLRKKLVILSGAGISAESGLRTFRDSDGLWEGHQVTDVATPGAWKRNPELVLDFYNMRRRDVIRAQPNGAHRTLARLAELFDVNIITQNIDDLHERAGSGSVLHLHGSILKMRGEEDEDTLYEIRTDMLPGATAPDGSLLRPAIVWFEEPVPLIEEAARLVEQADIFVVIGTSLVVYPAAGLIHYTPPGIPIYIIDRKVPETGLGGIIRIEEPASTGVITLARMLSAG